MTNTQRCWLLLVTLAGLSMTGASVIASPAGASAAAPQVRVLSTRSDLISGGNVLVEVIPAAGQTVDDLTLQLNGQDVSDAFSTAASGRILGLISGLDLGENTFSASAGGEPNQVSLQNHPSGGPVISGPHLQPWTCQGSAEDQDCNQPVQYSFHYLPEEGTELQPYDPENPPGDVAMTTTETGETVPFIVREEMGYIDRDQYKIAVLFDPEKDWTALAPQPQFNGKLLITHGASCGVDYRTGGAPSVLRYNPLEFAGDFPVSPGDDNVVYSLGRGFAVMSNALNNSGHNCNLPLQAESMIMTKEHLIEQYGELRYTIGVGCSGGALAMQWMANAYPGIYQGILPTCSFPDAWGTATQFADYHLLLDYFFEKRGGFHVEPKHPDWTPQQIAEVMGHVTFVNAEISENAQFHVAVASDGSGCGGISGDQLYHPETNPGGVRCAIQDAAVNVFGRRDQLLWTDPERDIGQGFAGFPIDNVGVQFGLRALQKGIITPQQFIDLNRDIGGLDIDANPTAERLVADESTLERAYRSGMINSANNLDQTAIIDCRGPDPGLFHDAYRTFAMRARLDREHGNHNNHLIWGGPVPLIADSNCHFNSLLAMDEWLAAVEQDQALIPLADKLTTNRPSDLTDMCWDGTGNLAAPALCPETVLTVYGTPRMVAGDAITTDNNKCQLKTIDPDDYLPHVGLPFAAGTPAPEAALPLVPLLTEAQLQELADIFPNGTCDFSVPGVGQQGTVPWQTYQDEIGEVIYGGQGLAQTADGSGAGWMSASFGGLHTPPQSDVDGDGVEGSVDQCPNTPQGEAVDANGCSEAQQDDDADGVSNATDQCEATPSGEAVDANGCSDSQKDADSDGVSDAADQCPLTPAGEAADANGCSDSQKDTDNDGINDANDLCPATSEGQAVDQFGCPGGSGELSVTLSADPATADITNDPVTVTFTATTPTTDANGGQVSYVFYYGDGTNSGVTTDTQKTNTYDQAGKYTARVVAVDQANNSASNAVTVTMTTTVTVEPQPVEVVADLQVQLSGGVAPVTAMFDASGSQAPEGAIYSFNFGDGSDPQESTESFAQRVYPLTGTYTVTLTVTDTNDSTNTDSATASFTVGDGQQTTALLTVNPSSVRVGDEVTFDARGSIAADGREIVSYTFDFGDGSDPVTRSVDEFNDEAGRTVYTYAQAGSFQPEVTVTDSAQATAKVASAVKVTPVQTPPDGTPNQPETPTPQTSSGGSLGWLMLAPLMLVGLRRRVR